MNAPLTGITIVDLSQFEAGPACTQLLAWLGAEVIKVERPGTGEAARTSVGDEPGNDSWSFLLLNSNKRSVTLDIKQPEGKELLRRLIADADVFIENFGPGVIDRLGFSYAEVQALNPRIVYASIKGFGEGSPWAGFPAFDPVGQAAGGSIAMTGPEVGPPVKPGVSLADTGAGLHAAIGIASALFDRERSGVGRKVEVAMQDTVMNFTRTAWQAYNQTGRAADRAESDFLNAPKGIYPTKPFGENDYIQIFTSRWPGSNHWTKLLGVLGREDLLDDPRFATPADRFAHREVVDALVVEWTASRTKFEAMTELGAVGIPASAVLDAVDLGSDEYLRERGMVVELEHPRKGRVKTIGSPIRVSGHEPEVALAPGLGEANDDVYAKRLSLTAAELADLRERRVI